MNLKIALDEAMERHGRVLNNAAADIAGQFADPELRREAAALLVAMLFTTAAGGSDDDGESGTSFESEGLAGAIFETMPR